MSKENHDNGRKQHQESLSDDIVNETKDHILHGTGYGNPPKNMRFRKGKSGNPAGRPRRPDLGPVSRRSANALALREAARKIGVREGGTVQRMPAIEAVLRAQYASAARGNAYAQKHILERYDWAQREEQTRIKEENETWAKYVDVQRRAIAEAIADGRPAPCPLPHPDDVVIDDETGVRFVGPLNAEQAADLDHTLKIIEVLIMQDVLDRRILRPVSDDPLDESGTAMVFMNLLNRTVPKRHRLSDTDILMRIAKYQTMTNRALLRHLYRDWRSLGGRPRRGTTFPPLKFAVDLMEKLDQMDIFSTVSSAALHDR